MTRAVRWLTALAVGSWLVLDFAGQGGWAITAAVGWLLLAVVVVVAGRRAAWRAAEIEDLRLTVAGRVGGRVHVAKSRWVHPSWWRRPILRTLVCRYEGHVADWSAAVQSEVAYALEKRLGRPVEIDWNHRTQGRDKLTLTVTVLDEAAASDPEWVSAGRVRAVAQQSISGDVTVEDLVRDGRGYLTQFAVRYPTSVKWASGDERAKVDASLCSLTGVRWVSDWRPEKDRAIYRRVAPIPDRVTHPTGLDGPAHHIPLGVGDEGAELVWDLKVDPHLVIAGATGAGKTSLLHTVLVAVTRRGIPVWAADRKRIRFRGFAHMRWPGLDRMATSLEDVTRLLVDAQAEIDRRLGEVEAGRVHEDDLPALVVMVDETAETVDEITDAWRDARGQGTSPAVRAIQYGARMAREANVHYVFGLQRADVKFLGGGETRKNVSGRAVLGPIEQADMTQLGVKLRVRKHPGRGTFILGGVEREGQAYYTPDPAKRLGHVDRAILDALYRPRPAQAETPILPAAVSPPVDLPAPPGGWGEPAVLVGVSAGPAEQASAEPEPGQPHLRLMRGGGEVQMNQAGSDEPAGQAGPEPLAEPSAEPGPMLFDLSTQEAASLLGCSDRMVSKHYDAGRLHRRRIGSGFRYARAEVERLARR